MWSPPEPDDTDPLEELTAAAISDRIDWSDWAQAQTTETLQSLEDNSRLDDPYGEDENNPEEFLTQVEIGGHPC